MTIAGSAGTSAAQVAHARRSRTHAVVLLALAAPIVAATVRSPGLGWMPTPSASNALVAYPVVLVAAGLVYFHWSTTRARADAWLTAVLALVGVQGLGQPVLARGLVALPDARGAWLALLDVVVALALLSVVVLCERVDLRLDPVAAGVGAGLLLVGLRALVLQRAPVWPLDHTTDTWVSGVLLAFNVAIGWRVLHLHSLPETVRVRLAGSAVLLGTGMAAASSGASGSLALGAIALTADLGCALLLVAATVGQVLRSMEDESEMAQLHGELRELRADRRDDRAHLHEVNSTLAGLASASTIMRSDLEITGPRRESLEAMMQSELHRLQRLLVHVGDIGDIGGEDTDLDEVVRHLVTAHDARGHRVLWQPSGLRAATGSDAVAEVLNILLDNAFQHGSPQTWVTVAPSDTQVGVSVTDTGPGVALEVRDRLFDWGVRRHGSPGEGTGLSIARGLAHGQAGTLQLDRTSDEGTRFTLLLPTRRQDTGTSSGPRPAGKAVTDRGRTSCSA